MAAFREHPLRHVLASEIRARPYVRVQAPARVAHIAALTDEGGDRAEREHVAALCAACGVAPPSDGADHFLVDLGGVVLKWERHTEFGTYTFYAEGTFDAPFDGPVSTLVPQDWLAAIPGQVLSATRMAFEPADAPERSLEDLAALFPGDTFTGSRMLDGQATVWTDYRIHADGHGRILIRDGGLNPRGAGRLIQRLTEVETYRMMAMLAFPVARETRPLVAAAEERLSRMVTGLADGGGGVEEERSLLRLLSRLAAEAEELTARTSYRFGASRAYYALVRKRVEELREERIVGLQPSGEFLYRRLIPAMDTCESVAARQGDLARRIAQASDLLRTRVDVALEEQNRDLLESMDRRAQLQLRLQETVEGLSVVAISYYLVGLVVYLAKGLKAAGLPVDPAIAAGVAIPVVLGLVWLGVRRLRRAVTGGHEKGKKG